MAAAKTVVVQTDPGHIFVPTVDGKHMDPITEHGVEVKVADLDKIVASANENGVRLTAIVGEESEIQTTSTPTGAQNQEG